MRPVRLREATFDRVAPSAVRRPHTSEDAPETPVLDALHLERLDLLRDILRCALELETPCDFAAAPGGRALNEEIFFSHFEQWRGLRAEWDELLMRNRAAPDRLWGRVAEGCARWRLEEPPVALGNAIDKLAMLTMRRAREWQLDAPSQLSLQIVSDRVGGLDRLTLYLERERVAAAPATLGEAEQMLVKIGEILQAIFDEVQQSPEARAISAARDSLIDLKHELLARLGEPDAALVPVPGCPLCDARRGAPEPVLAPGAGS